MEGERARREDCKQIGFWRTGRAYEYLKYGIGRNEGKRV